MDIKTYQDIAPWDWDKGAKKVFKATLLNRRADLSDRRIAAELAGNLVAIDDELAEDLLTIVGSGNEPDELRGTAAIALGAVLEHTYIEEFEDPDDSPINEDTYDKIREMLHALYLDKNNSKALRRRVFEASVHAPEDWHQDAVREAYKSTDNEWKLTAVFAMIYVSGFDTEIMESLKSEDPLLHAHAVEAAGTWDVKPAWPHIRGLLKNSRTAKPLLLAAIEAAGTLVTKEDRELLDNLTDSKDEDISEAALEAIAMAEGMADMDDELDDEDEDEEDSPWVN